MQTVAVQAQVGGTLDEVNFNEGQDITAGQMLFRIDRVRSRSRCARRRQCSRATKHRRRPRSVKRIATRRSSEKDYVTKSQADQAQSAAEAMKATVQADHAAVENAQLNLNYTTIKAPISGRAGRLLVRQGNLVKPNADPLVVINTLHPILVRFPIVQHDFPAVHRRFAEGSLRVRVVTADSGKVGEAGTLAFLDNAVDSLTGTVTAKARFENRANVLWPGEYVTVSLDLSTQSNVLAVQTRAVMAGQQGNYVFVVGNDKVAKVRPITVGRVVGDMTTISNGLAIGEQVVVDGQSRLTPNSRVDGKPATDATQAGAGRTALEAGKMNFSELFIRRPVTTVLVMAGILFFGITAYRRLSVSDLPTVDFPTITVNASLPGASPETMASAVATPLEKQFSTIAGIDNMTSSSGLGSCSITIQFTLERNIDAAAQDVQAMIAKTLKNLPPGIIPPSYQKVNPADQPILFFGFTSDLMPISQLDQYAETFMAQRISMIAGVAQVNVYGSAKYAVRIQLDPGALAHRQIGIDEVANAITDQNVNLPTGVLNGPNKAYTVQADGQLQDAASFRRLVVSYRNGAPVRLGELGQVLDDIQNNRSIAWFNNTRGVILAIQRQPGSNTVAVSDAVKELMKKLQTQVPASVSIVTMYDRAVPIRESVDDVKFTLLLTLVLVVAVIFLFLRNVSATLIPSLALPISVIGTFAVMYLLGYSLDNLSLMALTLAVGFVVDDAIVMLENIVRHMEMGKPPMKAAVDGAAEVGFTIISMTISLTAVFIPILFLGRNRRPVVPRVRRDDRGVDSRVGLREPHAHADAVEPVPAAARARREAQSGVRDHRSRVRLAARAILRAQSWVGDEPSCHDDGVLGRHSRRDGGVVRDHSEGIHSEPGQRAAVRDHRDGAGHVVRRHGDAPAPDLGDHSGRHEHSGLLFGRGWKPRSPPERTRAACSSASSRASKRLGVDDIIKELRPKLAKVPGIVVYMQNPPAIQIGGRVSKALYQFTMQSSDIASLYPAADKLVARARQSNLLQDVTSDLQLGNPQASVQIDRERAASLGVTANQIEMALYNAYGSRQVSTIYTPNDEYWVVMEMLPQYQADLSAMSLLYVRSKSGVLVPLSAVVSITQTAGPLSVNHSGQLPSVTLSFNLRPGVALGQATAEVQKFADEVLPASISTGFSGTAQAFQSTQAGMLALLGIAIFVIYVVLGVLYESFIHPITILSGLPFAAFGALLTLIICKIDLSVYAFVGIILLVGLVKKNAIMMIDFALEAERSEGRKPADAIVHACLIRFRPIMMTTMAALMGTLPIALSHGAGAESRRPLGVAVVGGLAFSQLITLFVTPVVYTYMDTVNQRMTKWFSRFGKKRDESVRTFRCTAGVSAGTPVRWRWTAEW